MSKREHWTRLWLKSGLVGISLGALTLAATDDPIVNFIGLALVLWGAKCAVMILLNPHPVAGEPEGVEAR